MSESAEKTGGAGPSPAIRYQEPLRVAMIRRTGGYEQAPEAVRELIGWCARNRLEINGFIRLIGFGKPSVGRPDRKRFAVAVPVLGGAPPTDGVSIERLPACRTLSVMHQGSPDAEGETFARLEKDLEARRLDYHGVITTYHPADPATPGELIEIALALDPI